MNRGFVRNDQNKNTCNSEGKLKNLYGYLSALRQLPQCIAANSKQPQLLSLFICTLSDSLAHETSNCEFLRCHKLHSLPFVHGVSCANTSVLSRRPMQQRNMDRYQSLTTLQRVQFARLGRNPNEFCHHSMFLAVRSTSRAKRTFLLAFVDIRNAISLCLHLCCTNIRIMLSFLHV